MRQACVCVRVRVCVCMCVCVRAWTGGGGGYMHDIFMPPCPPACMYHACMPSSGPPPRLRSPMLLPTLMASPGAGATRDPVGKGPLALIVEPHTPTAPPTHLDGFTGGGGHPRSRGQGTAGTDSGTPSLQLHSPILRHGSRGGVRVAWHGS